MKLLFLACLSPNTGNYTTAERIRAHVESAGHTCVLRDASEFKSSAEVAKFVTQKPPFEGALAIHLFKAGRLLLDVPVPFGIVFGGTDINEDVKVEHKLVVMKQVLQKARFAVAFTAKMKQMAYASLVFNALDNALPTSPQRSPSSKIYVQPQGIKTEATATFSWSEFLKNSASLEVHVKGIVPPWCSCTPAVQRHTAHLLVGSVSGSGVEQHRVFLLVCGLRRVKDPLYLAEVFTEWHRAEPLNVLVIIGPEIDSSLTEEVEAVAQRRAGVFLAQGRTQGELHAAMRRCFAVVNSSVSEGMSAAILEAMHLEVPVVARDIPGNAAIVQNGSTGLLYSSPQEFVYQSQRLLSDGELRESLVRKAKIYVDQQHSMEREREAYHILLQTLQ